MFNNILNINYLFYYIYLFLIFNFSLIMLIRKKPQHIQLIHLFCCNKAFNE
jgi:hypothetical protein